MGRVLRIGLIACLLATPGWSATAAVTDPSSTVDGVTGEHGGRAITYLGSIDDRPDLAGAGVGTEGYWFSQFDAPGPVSGAPTGERARDGLPAWVAAFNHATTTEPGCTEPGALERGCTPTYAFRTFSQDGPARSASAPDWARLRLPDGTCGRSGAIVDPQTYVAGQAQPDPTGLVFPRQGPAKPNNNNTINRIQLVDGVPDRFVIGIVTDTTARAHDPGRVEVRGNVGALDLPEQAADSQIEPVMPPGFAPASNGIPDVHLFRVEHFRAGDYLKLRLRGITSAASFGGLVFDRSVDPATLGPPPAEEGDGAHEGPGEGPGDRANGGANGKAVGHATAPGNGHDKGRGVGHATHHPAPPPPSCLAASG